ncbi:MAG: flippase-like domain-containing protein [Deltaproteobacteria bacterium]|nr:flippase-like domain-containing protein [Deltaproteobacteria bacterium]MCX7953243.1 flippase-like domain-containing protein [Deltaproteobacteria bacterium]
MSNIIRLIFGFALLCILFFVVDVQELVKIFATVSLFKFLLFFIFSFFLIFISALKWQALYRIRGFSVPLKDMFWWYFLSYAFGFIVPLGFVGADLARIQFAKEISNYKGSMSTVIQDRYTGFLTMFLVGTILCFFSKNIPPSISSLTAMIFFSGLVLPLIFFQIKIFKKYKDLILIYSDWNSTHFFVFFYSFLFYVSTVLNILIGAWVIDMPIQSIVDLSALLPLVFLASSLPVSPQGLGIQEGFYFFLFQFVGGQPEEALALALLLRIKVILLAILGTLIIIFKKNLLKNFFNLG